MAKGTVFMVVTGASVVVVRDGKRQSVPANSGFDFTESEVESILSAAPGSLRKPVNEGVGAPVTDADDADDADDVLAGDKPKRKKPTRSPAPEDEDI